jgi:hypothetical protein
LGDARDVLGEESDEEENEGRVKREGKEERKKRSGEERE